MSVELFGDKEWEVKAEVWRGTMQNILHCDGEQISTEKTMIQKQRNTWLSQALGCSGILLSLWRGNVISLINVYRAVQQLQQNMFFWFHEEVLAKGKWPCAKWHVRYEGSSLPSWVSYIQCLVCQWAVLLPEGCKPCQSKPSNKNRVPSQSGGNTAKRPESFLLPLSGYKCFISTAVAVHGHTFFTEARV